MGSPRHVHPGLRRRVIRVLDLPKNAIIEEHQGAVRQTKGKVVPILDLEKRPLLVRCPYRLYKTQHGFMEAVCSHAVEANKDWPCPCAPNVAIFWAYCTCLDMLCSTSLERCDEMCDV